MSNNHKKNIFYFVCVMLVYLFIFSFTTFSKNFSTVKKGDELTFGRYETFGRVNEIKWIVLDIFDDKILLFSKYIIDCKPYSDIKKYLNDICENSFNQDELEQIVRSSNNKIVENYEEELKKGYKLDYMFILSEEHIKKYFYNIDGSIVDDNVYGIGTNEAYDKGLNYIYRNEEDDSFASPYWLADRGYEKEFNKAVSYSGKIINDGYYWQRNDIGVRPALVIKMN